MKEPIQTNQMNHFPPLYYDFFCRNLILQIKYLILWYSLFILVMCFPFLHIVSPPDFMKFISGKLSLWQYKTNNKQKTHCFQIIVTAAWTTYVNETWQNLWFSLVIPNKFTIISLNVCFGNSDCYKSLNFNFQFPVKSSMTVHSFITIKILKSIVSICL